MIIDAHAHLWKKQNGIVNGKPVFSTGGGKSSFGGEIRQMMPPYMLNGENTAEMLVSNMDYAGVSGAVITQEQIDGSQDEYLLSVKKRYPERIKVCSLYEEGKPIVADGFDGIKICAGRLKEQDLTGHTTVFGTADAKGKFISIDLAGGDAQVASMHEVIRHFPSLKIAIGHFGMVTRNGWQEQIRLAQNPHVYIESGGITWLFHNEFYPYPSAVRAINEAAEICGFNKLMWGSDYPRTMTAITYKMSLDFIEKSNEIKLADKALLVGKNAKMFYDFGDLQIPVRVKNMVED